jgi:hypothetical protein
MRATSGSPEFKYNQAIEFLKNGKKNLENMYVLKVIIYYKDALRKITVGAK